MRAKLHTSKFTSCLSSLHALTKLELSDGRLFGRPLSSHWQSPTALRELCLNDMSVGNFWLTLLSHELICITAPALDSCKIDWDNNGEEGELEQKALRILR